jgi:large subunit ribosomal protein L29
MKMKQIKEMTEAELDHQMDELRKEKFKLGMQAKTGQLENPAKVRNIRRDVARMLTEKTRRAAKAAN